MLITILAEYRSGSTNLAKWFSIKDDFSVLIEPLNPIGLRYIKNSKKDINIFESNGKIKNPKSWEYSTKHLLVKEIYDKEIPYIDELIEISDTIIVLYRKDTHNQLNSFINGIASTNWVNKWIYNESNSNLFLNNVSSSSIENFYFVKNSIKNDFINTNKYFHITYEELYYDNGIDRIIEHIGLSEISNVNFPFGEKYRINFDKNKFI